MTGKFVIVLLMVLPLCRNLVIQPKLTVVDWASYNHHEPEGPGTYAFGYDIEDPATNNVQFRNEERHSNGTVTGSYGYVSPDGLVRVVHYVADVRGFRVTEENSHYHLSMLKPISETHTPEMAPAAPLHQSTHRLASHHEIHDQRTRPIDSLFDRRRPPSPIPLSNLLVSNNRHQENFRENFQSQENLLGDDSLYQSEPKRFYPSAVFRF